MNHFLSIDPGAKTTGWATFDENGDSERMGKIVDQNAFLDWLDELEPKPKEIIYEVYRNRPGKGNMMSVNQTSKLIGNIERYCHKNKIKVHKSESANLSIGLRYLGLYQAYGRPGVHCPDDVSALAHGVYILTKLKIRKHRLDRT